MEQSNMDNADKLNGRKVSEILTLVLDSHPKETITIGEFRDAIGNRSYGILMLLLALPCIIPIPTPGLSLILGMPLILLTFQWMIGLKAPWLPLFLTRREFKRSDMQKAFSYAMPYLEKLESFLKPRWHIFVTYSAERVIAIICFTLSIMIIMPIPFGNALPAFVIFLLSLSILTRDGVLVIVGLVIASLGTAVISTFVGSLVSAVSGLFS